jgi:hypothetical protein
MNHQYVMEDDTTKESEFPIPKLARPRFPNEILFVIGGCNSVIETNEIECYDYRADRWTKVSCIQSIIKQLV